VKKGKIEFIEKKKQSKKVHFIELDEVNEKELLEMLIKIQELIDLPNPPTVVFKNHCKKCAYYEYCFI
jgi:CRISPR-associated exonuclease Cas4